MLSGMDAVAAAAAEAVMRDDLGGGPGERQERVLLRPWLENLIHSGLIPGLEWIDAGQTMFKVPWKHRSKKNWSLRHSSVFLVSDMRYDMRCYFNMRPKADMSQRNLPHGTNN